LLSPSRLYLYKRVASTLWRALPELKWPSTSLPHSFRKPWYFQERPIRPAHCSPSHPIVWSCYWWGLNSLMRNCPEPSQQAKPCARKGTDDQPACSVRTSMVSVLKRLKNGLDFIGDILVAAGPQGASFMVEWIRPKGVPRRQNL
jgi:hypothetical protein